MIINTRIGVVGGKEHAKLLVREANKWNLDMWIMDSSFGDPAARATNQFIEGDVSELDQIYALGKHVEIITCLDPVVPISALQKLENEGKEVYPQSSILRQLVQNRNNLFSSFGIKVSSIQEIRSGCKILTVVGNRNEAGNTSLFPILTTIPASDPVDVYSTTHIRINSAHLELIKQISTNILTDLNLVGTLTLRFLVDLTQNISGLSIDPFLTQEGSFTLDSCSISQYEQHIRSIMNLPLMSVKHPHRIFHLALISQTDPERERIVSQIPEILAQENIHCYIYGGQMYPVTGHITIIEDDEEQGIKRVRELQKMLFQ